MIFEARYSTGLYRLLIVACLIFAGVGLWISGTIIDMYDPHPMTGWGIAIGCLIVAAIFYRRIQDPEPQVRIDEFGIKSKSLDRRVGWSEVAAVGIFVARNQRMLTVTLKDPDAQPLAGGVARLLSRADQALGLGTFGISVANLDRGFDEMVAAVRHYRPDLFEDRI